MWDYLAMPVKVKNPDLPANSPAEARLAFDGYGGSLRPDVIARCWVQRRSLPEKKPFSCTIDYGSPVALSKLVHYFYTPLSKDYRTDPFLLSSAFASLNIYRSDDGARWARAERLEDLPFDWPQVLTFSHPAPARYYKLEITGLVPGAQGIRTYEIESFTGPAIHIPNQDSAQLNAGETCYLRGSVVGAEDTAAFSVAVAHSKNDVESGENSASVESGGAFIVALTPLRSGQVPVTLELRDEKQVAVDRRRVTLHVAPRVVVSDVKVDGDAVTGRLFNTASVPLSVKVGSGRRSLPASKLAPGKASEFRLVKAVQYGGRQIAELSLKEDDRASSRWLFSVERPAGTSEGRLHSQEIDAAWTIRESQLQFRFTPDAARTGIRASLEVSFDETPVSFSASIVQPDKVVLCGAVKQGSLECTLQLSGSAVRAVFRSVPDGLDVERAPGIISLRVKAEGVRFRFMPAYVYSKEPVSTMEGTVTEVCLPHPIESKQELSTIQGGWLVPTRMVALETAEGTVGLVPDRDRCLMGIDQDDAVVRMRLGAEPAEILIPAVAGDWYEAFRYVVNRIYQFTDVRQYRALTETVCGEMGFLAHYGDAWSKGMQVLTSFPKMDFVFVFYGLTYSIPALYSWYLMSGDEEALERARKSVEWLLEHPDVRIKEGPTAGACFSQYLSPAVKPHPFGQVTTGGCDQAWNRWLEPHATGAVAWTLLFFYVADGKRHVKALEAAKGGLEWLLTSQSPSGGWAYAYHPDGKKVTEEEGSGSIWSIWALFRYGKLTGEQKYLDAAERGKKWFASKFISNHICRGYWEDVSGSKGRVGLSWGAYEFSIAANVFAEMGDAELAVEAAKNAATWIWTRVLDCRSYFTSYAHTHEQWGWPPATYLAPMFGLAAQTAYRLTGDDFFRRMSGAAKTISWWTVKETPQGIWPAVATKSEVGGAIWPGEAVQFVPIEEPFSVAFWMDWITAQQATISLRWLIQEVNLRSGGKVNVDPDTLAGTVLGKPGRLRLRPGELSVKGNHQEINWLGYETENSRVLGLINDKGATTVKVDFPAAPFPAASLLISQVDGRWQEETRKEGGPIRIDLPAAGCAFMIWKR